MQLEKKVSQTSQREAKQDFKLPAALYRAEQVRELDRIAIEELGIPGARLMERAGAVTFESMRRHWPDARRIRILCGGGNNGGDGFVIARYAKCAGLDVGVFSLGDPAHLGGEARGAFDTMLGAGLAPAQFEVGGLEAALEDADVVIDALFGTGLDREVTGRWAEAIAAINASPGAKVAVDIPSGLHADTGQVLGCAVRADLTVTFIGLKQGLLTGEGRDRCGRLLFDDLAVPEAVYGRFPPNARRVDYGAMRHLLAQPRARAAHKGDFGHVLVFGGETGFAGAARMAGEAAARAGAGLVSIATRAVHAAIVGSSRPELMCHGVESAADLKALLPRATVLAVGPGLGQSGWGRTMLETVLETDLPMVIDADGLNLLATLPGYGPDDRQSALHNFVLTPHPGEAGRLLGQTTAQVQNDRFRAARALVARFGGTVVLKGSGTLILDERGDPCIAWEGNPGMASGGMGDVLTGVIAGLMAQGMTMGEAARLGVCLHGRAADLAAAEDGERGMLAGDLMDWVRRLVNPGIS
uniref:Bifunctional NAD(P)H-hydrate repair enzyme n=1 Tax=Candidatus Kentrum eta TaxID=2126337 RepID=A0A450VDT8_9GAMM|nr:MAG: NAD(P)H-hydrate epimerase [Candidatus Kentron sp. H]VFK02934.1 MAG: NAD(P)H-hydrate epimerase [Candidatus Kentron sp. H]VFK05673.1 MAG: NAD(P)H-hydrate epimerase [Candidatus Kentron sp. H]